MGRFLAGLGACLLLVTGVVMLWQGRATSPAFPDAPQARLAAAATPAVHLPAIGQAPGADAKSKEEKRFDRADKNKDGRILLAELVEPRRKPFAKLDLDRDGKLSFEEWSVKTIDKFKLADGDGSAWLTRAEYAATAPKPKAKKAACSCAPSFAQAED